MNKFLTLALLTGMAAGSYVVLSDPKAQKSMQKSMRRMRRTAMKQINHMF